MRVLILFLAAMSFNAQANCWRVGEFKGYSSIAGNDYKVGSDGISGATFTIQISGKTSGIIPNQDMRCLELAPHSLLCLYSQDGRGTAETWSVDPAKGVAYYSRSRSGFGPFDGSAMFVGRILGSCQ